MGARWLLRGTRRVGKEVISVVLFFEEAVELWGDQCRMRGRWLPYEVYRYGFDGGRDRDVGTW